MKIPKAPWPIARRLNALGIPCLGTTINDPSVPEISVCVTRRVDLVILVEELEDEADPCPLCGCHDCDYFLW